MNLSPFKNWWLLGLKGFLALLFGVVALIYPQDTIIVLTLYFGILNLATGILLLIFAVQNRRELGWGWFLAEAIIDILFGIVVLAHPAMTAMILTILIGAWILLGGIFQTWFAIRNRKKIFNYGMTLFNGIVTILLGAAIAFFPTQRVVTLSWLIGFTAIFFGSLLIVTAFFLRRFQKTLED